MFSATLKLTAAGRALLAKAQASGATVTFTGVKIGSGSLGATDPDTLTDVITAVQTCPIVSISRSGDSVYIGFTMTNNNSAAYYLREMALMATDPQSGSIAYMYANDGANAELIPAASSTAIEREVTIIVKVSAATSVTATISSGVYATKSDLDAHIADNIRHITAAERTEWNAKVGVGSNGKIPSSYLPSMDYIPTAEKGAASGVPTLDASGKIPVSQIPDLGYASLVGGKLPLANAPDLGAWQTKGITTADWAGTLTANSYVSIPWDATYEFYMNISCPVAPSSGGTVTAKRVIHGVAGYGKGILLLGIPGEVITGDKAPADVTCTTTAATTMVKIYTYASGAVVLTSTGTVTFGIYANELRIYAAAYTNPANAYGRVTGTMYRRRYL